MTFSIALKPLINSQAETATLKHLVRRINEERGAFRNVTEAQLKEEIAKNLLDENNDTIDVEEEDTPQDLEKRRKEVFAARNEMLQFIGQAQNEALTALDFVSLLLTKEVPRADTSLSPFLKTTVPKGTLDFDRSDASRATKSQDGLAKAAAAGWSLSSLNASADKLLGAAQRLEKEMEKETKYWDQILSVSEKGWSMRRMPREPHTVGVWFGFSEAGSLYSARGLAALRPDSSGDIMLDQRLSASARTIQVQVVEDGHIAQTTKLASLRDGDDELEEIIRHARDSLFDEELFHEMTREARTFASWGIVVREDRIRIPIYTPKGPFSNDSVPQQHEVVIELVSNSHQSNITDADTRCADAIALALRLLMVNIYRQRFRNRSQPPQPLTDQSLPTPTYEILQPTMNYLNHTNCSTSLVKKIAVMQKLLQSAGITSSPPQSRFDSNFLALGSAPGPKAFSLVEHLKKPLKSVLSFSFSESKKYEITIESHLSAPIYGSSFELGSTDTSESRTLRVNLRSVVDLERQLATLAEKAVADHIVKNIPGSLVEDTTGSILLAHSSARTAGRTEVTLQHNKLALVRRDAFFFARILGLWDAEGSTPGKTAVEIVQESIND